jgi:hypothetical protein
MAILPNIVSLKALILLVVLVDTTDTLLAHTLHGGDTMILNALVHFQINWRSDSKTIVRSAALGP